MSNQDTPYDAVQDEKHTLDDRDVDFFNKTAALDCDYYKSLYDATGNPLYVWSAIRAIVNKWFLDREGKKIVYELPLWCVEYLIPVARNLHDLALLRDIRSPPASEGNQDWDWAKIKADDAPKLTAFALRLTSQGKSAFRDYRANVENQLRKDRYFALRRTGLSERESIDRLLEELGEEDERTLRRQFAAAPKV